MLRAVCAGRLRYPLLWCSLSNYSSVTSLQWASDSVQAYTSTSTLAPKAPVAVGFATAVQLGQLLSVQAGGIGTVSSVGVGGAIAVYNTTATAYTTGLALQMAAGNAPFLPICGVPLHGNEGQVMVPLPKLLLLFSPVTVPVGQAVQVWPGSAYGGVLVDLSAAAQRTVAFDINAGWSWGTDVWAQVVPFGTDLSTVLITSTLTALNARAWMLLQMTVSTE